MSWGGPVRPTRVVETMLAIMALLGLAAGAYLGHQTVSMFSASVSENQARAEDRQRSWSLQQHVADMTAPGNDIFQSRNVRPETRKFYTSRAVVRQALTTARREIARTMPREEARPLLADLLTIRRAVKSLVVEVRRIFQAFRDNDVDQALRRQATMNRRAASLRAAFGALTRHLDEVEDRRVARQAAAAGRLVTFERWIALLLLAGVGGILFYGRRAELRNERLAAEQQRSLAALRDSEGRNGAILASALDAIVTMNREGRIIEFNPAAESIFGYRRDEVLGRSLAETIVPPAARAAHDAGVARYLATRTRTTLIDRRVEVMAMRAGGEEFPAEIAISALAGDAPTFTATVRDITERRRAEAELAAARDHAVEAVRVKSEFMANMSHEIRTPMNIVFGMAEMLLDSPLTAEQRDQVEALQRNAQGLLRIIDDVLDFSKIEAGKVALESIEFSLRGLVGETAAALAGRAARRGLTLAAHVDADVPDDVVGDPTRLRQVLLNLVDNAIKFTEHGSVRIDVRPEPSPTGVVMRFAVTDTGIGIPREKQAAVFDAFTQADGTTTRRYGGTGLGLTICVQLVGLMGGRIWLESEPGRGTTFFFTVPMDEASAARAVA